MGVFAVILLILTMMTVLIVVVYHDNPFEPPMFTYYIDITGRSNFNADRLIHDLITDNISEFAELVKKHQNETKKWIQSQQQFLKNANFKKKKEAQYRKALEVANSYMFVFTKGKTSFCKVNDLYNSKVSTQDLYIKSLTYDQLVEMFPVLSNDDA